VIGIRLDADKEFLVCCTTLFFKRGKVRRAMYGTWGLWNAVKQFGI